MSHTAKFLTAAAAGALVVGLGAAPQASAATFYDPPADLPAGLGSLVRTEPMNLASNIKIGGLPISVSANATRLMYTSTDELGEPVAVSGAYLEPTKKWQGNGPRPLVAFAAGTQGQGDACAPSKSLEKLINSEAGELGIGYELPSVTAYIDKGIAVVVTDYIGLGTTDRVHSYTNRLDMAHALLDAARAAVKVDGASVTSASPVGLHGYSQGGGAAGAAAELAPQYAPELNLKGAFVGAPPADLQAVTKSADNTTLTGVIAYAINGIIQYHPALQAKMDEYTTDEGKKALKAVSTQCIGSTAFSYGFAKTSKWTKNGKSAYDIVRNDATLKAAVDKQRIGKLKPAIPVHVMTGTQDDIVDHGQARQLAKDWCAKGVNVKYQPIIQLFGSGGTALNHLGPMLTNSGDAHTWLTDRLSGKSAKSNCSSLWMLP